MYSNPDSNGTFIGYATACNFISFDLQLAITYIDDTNREFVPGTLMVCFSSMLVAAVFRSRYRVASSVRDRKRLRRDVRLAANCFFMNFTFLLLNTPNTVAYLYPTSSDWSFDLVLWITYTFFFCYGVNFYIIIVCNSLFRAELLRLLGKISPIRGSSVQRTNVSGQNILGPSSRSNNRRRQL